MRYILGLLVAIGLVIILIIVIASGGNDTDPSRVPNSTKRLQDYADVRGAQVRLTIAGPIVAEQNYKETRITVDVNSSVIENIRGYQGSVASTETTSNNRESFVNFLRAIDRAGFTQGNTDKALADERGYCALGKRYIFDLIENGRTVQHFWSSTCTGTKSFEGNTQAATSLFTAQIPSYDRMVGTGEALSR